LRTYQRVPGALLDWPASMQPTATAVLPAAGDPSISISSGGTHVFGPFKWKPSAENDSILASVTATDDLSNIDPTSVLPVNTGPTPHARFVQFDNNIAQRDMMADAPPPPVCKPKPHCHRHRLFSRLFRRRYWRLRARTGSGQFESLRLTAPSC